MQDTHTYTRTYTQTMCLSALWTECSLLRLPDHVSCNRIVLLHHRQPGLRSSGALCKCQRGRGTTSHNILADKWDVGMDTPKPFVIKITCCLGIIWLIYLVSYTTNDNNVRHGPAPVRQSILVFHNPVPVEQPFPDLQEIDKPRAKPMVKLTAKPTVNPSVPWWQEFLCKLKGHEAGPGGPDAVPLKQLFRDVTPKNGKNVFLMDTACNSNPKYRVWCAVESWAKHNPNRQVWFLLTSGRMEGGGNFTSNLMRKYKNLHVVKADLYDFFRDTPLLKLFESRKWAQKSTWPVELLSDMLRVLVLWHWGGVYSDTDVISLRKLALPPNSLGFEHAKQLGSAFYSFTAHHPTLHRLMEDMVYHFRTNDWGCIGPKAISRVMEKECGKTLAELLQEAPVPCPGNITLHPATTFYPVRYDQFETYFANGGGKNFDKTYKSASALHFWNKMSKNRAVEVNGGSVYEVVAQKSCPTTYRAATANSKVF